jgi:valyl-tRNA synthetase
MKAFFPGELLETGYDILFFWVARMVMMSLELTDQLPFKTIFLHPMVRDEEGGKMSKSKGNVIDPLEVMDSCNLDVLLQKLYESNLPESEVKKAIIQKKKDFP